MLKSSETSSCSCRGFSELLKREIFTQNMSTVRIKRIVALYGNRSVIQRKCQNAVYNVYSGGGTRHVMAAILGQLVTTDDESLLAAFPLSTFYNLHEWTLLLSTLRALLVVLTRYEHLLCGKCCVLSSRSD